MLCDICQRAATGWCRTCNAYFCSDHGGNRCFRCAGAFMAVDAEKSPMVETGIQAAEYEPRQGGKGYLQCTTKPAMPTIYVDDPGPPECYECGGLAKKLCTHCHALFCLEHAGTGDLCANCKRSSLLGIIVLAVLGLLVATVLLAGMLLY